MSGWMKRYKESLRETPGPILLDEDQDKRVDLRGIMNYAKEKGVAPAELTEMEKERFIVSDRCNKYEEEA